MSGIGNGRHHRRIASRASLPPISLSHFGMVGLALGRASSTSPETPTSGPTRESPSEHRRGSRSRSCPARVPIHPSPSGRSGPSTESTTAGSCPVCRPVECLPAHARIGQDFVRLLGSHSHPRSIICQGEGQPTNLTDCGQQQHGMAFLAHHSPHSSTASITLDALTTAHTSLPGARPRLSPVIAEPHGIIINELEVERLLVGHSQLGKPWDSFKEAASLDVAVGGCPNTHNVGQKKQAKRTSGTTVTALMRYSLVAGRRSFLLDPVFPERDTIGESWQRQGWARAWRGQDGECWVGLAAEASRVVLADERFTKSCQPARFTKTTKEKASQVVDLQGFTGAGNRI